jgi:hypothetical protein
MINELSEGIIQITLDESRWYYDADGKPHPSVTTILESFPKGYGMYLWLADKIQSYDEVRAIMKSRGEEGSMAHWAMENYLLGKQINFHDEHPEFERGFTAREWQMVLAGKRWCDTFEPVVKFIENPVFGEVPGDYAGTVDMVVLIDGEKFAYNQGRGKEKETILPYGEGQIPFMGDWKTSQAIYDSHKAQVAAYAIAGVGTPMEVSIGGIIRLGSKHKVGYEFWHGNYKEMERYKKLFDAAYTFWSHENPNPAPKVVDVPMAIQIDGQIELPREVLLPGNGRWCWQAVEEEVEDEPEI